MDNTLGVYVEAFYFTKYNYGSTAGFCLEGQTKVACHVACAIQLGQMFRNP